jgi:biotin carboxyl carrier protein
MIFFVRYAEEEHKVRVEVRNGQMMVRFDDEAEEPLDLAYYGNDCSYLRNNQVFFANVVGSKENSTVFRPQGNLHFTVESEYRRIVGLLRGQDLMQENNVLAKMPGKIAKIIAKVGDTVEKGASLLVMEAMKMENEIRSTARGKILRIHVKEGQAVETGALLIELELSESDS